METKRDKVRLSFQVIGSLSCTGLKSPIIFLHGLTSAKETWSNVIRPISAATGRKAYAFDARNHGDSGWSDDCLYDVMVEDLFEFVKSIPAKRAILIGHSMGGKTAMYFAAKYPEKVEKLIVEDISPKPSPPKTRQKVLEYVEQLKRALEQIPPETKSLEEAANFVNGILLKNTPQEERSRKHGTRDGYSLPLHRDSDGKFHWKTNLQVIEKFLSAPSTVTMGGPYTGPTLLLYGTNSPYKASADREYIRQMFPACQLRAVEGATHQIHLEYEDIFVKEVVEFINDSS